jgi:hypothetical protein
METTQMGDRIINASKEMNKSNILFTILYIKIPLLDKKNSRLDEAHLPKGMKLKAICVIKIKTRTAI